MYDLIFDRFGKIVTMCMEYEKPLELVVSRDKFDLMKRNINHSHCRNIVLSTVNTKRAHEVGLEPRKKNCTALIKDIERKEEELHDYRQTAENIEDTIISFQQKLQSRCGLPVKSYGYGATPVISQVIDQTTLHDAVNTLGRQFVESILFTDNGSFILVSQLEIYYTDSVLDDCANLMIKSLDDLHNNQPVVHLNIKNEGNGGWMELRVFFEKFELLIIGGIVGKVDGTEFNVFLGASRVPEINCRNCFIFTPISPVETAPAIRLLRDYQKCIQVGFQAKPLKLHLNPNVSYHSLASFIIDKASSKSFSVEDQNQLIAMLESTDYRETLGISAESSTDDIVTLVDNLLSKKRIARVKKIGKHKLWIIRNTLKYDEDLMFKGLTDLYKNYIYAHCRGINDKTAENFLKKFE